MIGKNRQFRRETFALRMVAQQDWELKLADPERRQRLLCPPSAEALIAQVVQDATVALEQSAIPVDWKKADEKPGYFRAEAQLPVAKCTFDLLFNSRSGYRAQYYLSPEEGILYNRCIIDYLIPVMRLACGRAQLEVAFKLIERSLMTPHAKIWITDEKEAFGNASEYSLNPRRWVDNDATLGRRCPLPDHPKIDLKGSFIDPYTQDFWVCELKADRACDLYHKGYT